MRRIAKRDVDNARAYAVSGMSNVITDIISILIIIFHIIFYFLYFHYVILHSLFNYSFTYLIPFCFFTVGFAKSLLDVGDDFERAIKAVPVSFDEKTDSVAVLKTLVEGK